MISIHQTDSKIKSTTEKIQQDFYTKDTDFENQLLFATLDYSPDDDINLWAASQLDLGPFDHIVDTTTQTSHVAMQPDAGGALTQFAPGSGRGRGSHHRESSLSSMGSLGPASPYNHHSYNPQIAVTDSSLDGFHGIPSTENNPHGGVYYQTAKATEGQSFGDIDTSKHFAYPVTVSGLNSRPRMERGLLPAADFLNAPNRSYPPSVTSSTAGDSPATPILREAESHGRRRRAYENVPKLDRTMTDVYADDLYSPNFTIISSSPTQSHQDVSAGNRIFTECLNAANSQHLNSVHSPSSTASRALSPFRDGSPFAAPGSVQLGTTRAHPPLGTTRQSREEQFGGDHHQKFLLGQQLPTRGRDQETPKTISPKDAVLEFNESDNTQNFTLFPNDASGLEFSQLGSIIMENQVSDATQFSNDQQQGGLFASLPNFDSRIPQQYPFIPRHDSQQVFEPTTYDSPGDSSVSVASERSAPPKLTKPAGSGADGGTYTCTYHGCVLRFETPTQLQRHKREGHRQSQNIGGIKVHEAQSPPSATNSQAGPHRCDRINPSTGKPCNSIFSRPYDLTRHEDTIHNARKLKVRCDMCTEEKTFSRADALTRHYRVCHPDVELPGKQRRRAT